MSRSAVQIADDPTIVIVNPTDDTSVAAIEAWLAELESDGDWLDLPCTAAELIAEERAELDA